MSVAVHAAIYDYLIVLVRQAYSNTSDTRQYRLLVADGHLLFVVHNITEYSRSQLILATVELADPTSLDPATILGLTRGEWATVKNPQPRLAPVP